MNYINKVRETPSPARKTRTVDEVAAALGICRNAAYRAISNGQIPYIRIGKRILVPDHGLQKLLDAGNSKTAA